MLKQISKYIGIVVIAILALYLAYMVILGAKYYLAKWEMARKVETFNNLVLQMFKDDTYGGKTPEETYNLFVDALKNQDVNLAVMIKNNKASWKSMPMPFPSGKSLNRLKTRKMTGKAKRW